MKIWTLKICTPSDEITMAFEDYTDAFNKLAEYVQKNWDDHMAEDAGEFEHLSKDKAVDLFFQKSQWKFYELEEAPFYLRTIATGPGEKRKLSELGLFELFQTAAKKLGSERKYPPSKKAIAFVRSVFKEVAQRFSIEI